MSQPIDLYTTNTPNGQRACVVLEELGLAYNLNNLDIFAGEAKTPDFMKINPLGRLPVIIDHDGPDGKPIKLTQSWLICLYLAKKTKRFIPSDPVGELRVTEWLFHLASDVMMVHTTHNTLMRFVPEKVPSVISFYEGKVGEAFEYLEGQLAGKDYLAGELSVADLAFYPVFNRRRSIVETNSNFSNLARWGKNMDARPACRRGVEATANAPNLATAR
jgi:GST-like protein